MLIKPSRVVPAPSVTDRGMARTRQRQGGKKERKWVNWNDKINPTVGRSVWNSAEEPPCPPPPPPPTSRKVGLQIKKSSGSLRSDPNLRYVQLGFSFPPLFPPPPVTTHDYFHITASILPSVYICGSILSREKKKTLFCNGKKGKSFFIFADD